MPAEPEAVNSPLSALLVGGSAEPCATLRETLEAMAFAVLHAATVAEAISILALLDADLVIVDLEPAPMEGLRLVNWLLQLPPARQTPRIIALSTDASLEAALRLLNIEIVRKPIAAGALHGALQRVLDCPGAGMPPNWG